jgi:uncharacterized protein YlxW (UPF0749 family)
LELSASTEERNRTGAELQKQIIALKSRIARLDARIEEIERRLDERSSIGAGLNVSQPGWIIGVADPGTCAASKATYYDPYKHWCEEPARLSFELERKEAERDRLQEQLEELQERARRMGYGSAFYDPE